MDFHEINHPGAQNVAGPTSNGAAVPQHLPEDGRKNGVPWRPSAAVGHPQRWVVLVRKERPKPQAERDIYRLDQHGEIKGMDTEIIHISYIYTHMYMYMCM